MTLHYGMAAQRNADESGTTPLDDRKNIEGLFVRAGAMRRGADALVAGTAGWTFTLNAAWYVTQRAVGDGLQLWGNDGAITLTASAAGTALPTSAPAAGLSRYYRVWVRHRVNETGLDATSVPDAGVEFSDAASSPVLPALPTGATEVATNLMTSAATSTSSAGNTLTITMPWTAARGGVVHCRAQAELDAVASVASAANPILAELDGTLYVCAAAAVEVASSADTGWSQTPLTLGTGVTHYTSSGWGGLQARVQNGVLYVNGAAAKATWAAGAEIATLAEGYRPSIQAFGLNCQLSTAGVLTATATVAASGAAAFALVAPLGA